MSRSERPGDAPGTAPRDPAEFDFAEFGEVAAELALALPPVEPSPELKARLMARIAVTPQLAAESSAAVPVAVAPLPLQDAPAESPAELRARTRWFTRPAVSLTAAAAAVALFLGGVATANLLVPQDDSAQQLAAIVAAPDVQTVAAPVAEGGSATLVSSASLGLSAMVFEGLPELSDDEAYALWYITDGEPAPAGLFTVDGEGRVVQVLEGAFHAGTVVGVTVEPRSGSLLPTTAPIVAIPTEA